MIQTINDNLKATWNKNNFSQAVGRSFIYTAVASAILNGGNLTLAIASGGTFAALTFTASLLSPVVAGILGEKIGHAAKDKALFANGAAIGLACVVAHYVLNLRINLPALLLSFIPTIFANGPMQLGVPLSVMSFPGTLASYLVTYITR